MGISVDTASNFCGDPPETSEILCPNSSVSDGGEGVLERRGSGGGGRSGGGAGKLMVPVGDFGFETSGLEFNGGEALLETGNFDFEISGLEFNGGEGLLEVELVGEAELEDGYDGVLESTLLLR